jgi:hypothetical protein
MSVPAEEPAIPTPGFKWDRQTRWAENPAAKAATAKITRFVAGFIRQATSRFSATAGIGTTGWESGSTSESGSGIGAKRNFTWP